MTEFAAVSQVDWRRLAEKALAGAPFEALVSETDDGIAYGPVYPAAPVRPIVRSASGPWSIAQRLDDPDPRRANTQALVDLEGGADALSLVLAGAPSAHGFGLPVEAIGTALGGVLLDIIHLRIEAGGDGLRAAQAVQALAAAQGLSIGALDLDLATDTLGSLALSGDLPRDDGQLRQSQADLAGTLIAEGFSGRLFEADGRLYHEAGASEAQELAAVLAGAVYALRIMEGCGIALADAVARLGFTLAADQRQFHVMAKLRALRLLWQRVQTLSGVAAPQPARLHVETSFRMMAAIDPHTNILRQTVAAVAAATGGADRLSVLPFTAANGLPEAKARRLARNTQLILRDEAGLGHVADPAAGSGGIAALTEGMAAAAWREFQRIEAEGGLFASLRDGQLQRRIGTVRETRAAAAADRREPLIGVTFYPPAQARDIPVLLPRPKASGAADPGDPRSLRPVRLSEPMETAQ